jgi:hypothetical protein
MNVQRAAGVAVGLFVIFLVVNERQHYGMWPFNRRSR